MHDSKKVCYSCYDDHAFRFFGQTERFLEMLKDYTDAIVEDATVQCSICKRNVKYIREDNNWREVTIEQEVNG